MNVINKSKSIYADLPLYLIHIIMEFTGKICYCYKQKKYISKLPENDFRYVLLNNFSPIYIVSFGSYWTMDCINYNLYFNYNPNKLELEYGYKELYYKNNSNERNNNKKIIPKKEITTDEEGFITVKKRKNNLNKNAKQKNIKNQNKIKKCYLVKCIQEYLNRPDLLSVDYYVYKQEVEEIEKNYFNFDTNLEGDEFEREMTIYETGDWVDATGNIINMGKC